MDNDAKREEFLEMYKQLCEEYGMYIGVYCGEGSFGEVGVEIEDSASENELTDHFKEIEGL